jgi:hypothetical protein
MILIPKNDLYTGEQIIKLRNTFDEIYNDKYIDLDDILICIYNINSFKSYKNYPNSILKESNIFINELENENFFTYILSKFGVYIHDQKLMLSIFKTPKGELCQPNREKIEKSAEKIGLYLLDDPKNSRIKTCPTNHPIKDLIEKNGYILRSDYIYTIDQIKVDRIFNELLEKYLKQHGDLK